MDGPATGDPGRGTEGTDGGASPPPEAPDTSVSSVVPDPEPTARRVRRAIVVLVGVLLAYYAAPIGSLPSGVGIAVSVVGVLAGVSLLAFTIVRHVQHLMRAGDDTNARLDGLVILVFLVLPIFALGYLALESYDASQFDDLETKTDALYFTVSTIATVGYGDVHATGQLSRGLVTLQMAFDLVFVAAVVSVLTTQLRQRAQVRRSRARSSAGGGSAEGRSGGPDAT